jgi:hypothetical protein
VPLYFINRYFRSKRTTLPPLKRSTNCSFTKENFAFFPSRIASELIVSSFTENTPLRSRTCPTNGISDHAMTYFFFLAEGEPDLDLAHFCVHVFGRPSAIESFDWRRGLLCSNQAEAQEKDSRRCYQKRANCFHE